MKSQMVHHASIIGDEIVSGKCLMESNADVFLSCVIKASLGSNVLEHTTEVLSALVQL